MDDADRSEIEIENNLKVAIYRAKKRTVNMVACGVCHWCGASVTPGRLFCDDPDNGCEKDWQHDRERRIVNGL